MLLGLSGRLKTLATAGKFGKEFQDISNQYKALYNQLKTPSPVAKDLISIDNLSEAERRYLFSLDDKGEIDLEDFTLGETYPSKEALGQALGIDFDDMISMSEDLKPGDAGFFTQQSEIEKQQELTEIETQRNLLRKVNEEIQLLKSDRKTSGRTRDEVAELDKKIKKFENQKKQIQSRIFVLR